MRTIKIYFCLVTLAKALPWLEIMASTFPKAWSSFLLMTKGLTRVSSFSMTTDVKALKAVALKIYLVKKCV